MAPNQSPASGETQPPASGETQPPTPLETLRDSGKRLAEMRDGVRMSPDLLDAQATETHRDIVMPAYESMRTEVDAARSSDWVPRDRERFDALYAAAARKWPAYRQGLAELDSLRLQGRTQVAAMRRLEGPRDDYIKALFLFSDELSALLGRFFPSQ